MLTERERYVLESIINRWDLALPGDISYSDVTALCERLNVPEPPHMRQMLSQYEADSISCPRCGKIDPHDWGCPNDLSLKKDSC